MTSLPDVSVLPLSPMIQKSLRDCAKITRLRAKNFYFGLKLTPGPKRAALYAVYAFMRACDDLADEAMDHLSSQEALARIERFRHNMLQVVDAPLGENLPTVQQGHDVEPNIWPAFQYVYQTYRIDIQHLHAMLDGQVSDIQTNRYATFQQTYQYCYNVASVVGFVCLSIWGCDNDPTVSYMAEQRGLALQLTNILRDLVEDAHRNRMYLPEDELNRFDLTADTLIKLLVAGQADDRFDKLMAYQLQRVATYYQQCAGLDQHISPACQPTSWAIVEIYRRLFYKIKQNPRAVLSQRIKLSLFEKVKIGLLASRQKMQHS